MIDVGVIRIFCIFVFCLRSANSNFRRNLTFQRTPGCDEKFNVSCNLDVFYIRAAGNNDTLHYLWDFVDYPSLLLIHADLDSTLSINWNDYLANKSDSIRLNTRPHYSFMVIVENIIEYNDTDDIGLINDNSKNISYNLSRFNWAITKDMYPDTDFIGLEMAGTKYNAANHSLSGLVRFQLSAFASEGHEYILPRLLHSANSTEVRLELLNLLSNSGFSSSRWAVELSIITSDHFNETILVDPRRTLDDENSPGVFSVYNLVSPGSVTSDRHGGYLQWRPVVYTTTIPSIGNSSDVNVLEPSSISQPRLHLKNTLADKYFGKQLKKTLAVRTILSFGAAQDGFYKKTNYSSWSFIVSYGVPQFEGFSMLIILVLAIGLGLPAVLVLFGGIFLCFRRFKYLPDELSSE